MRPGRNLYGRLARLAAHVGPPEPEEEPDEALLASFKSFEIAAGPLGGELVRRLGWMEDDLSKASFPRALDEVERALREGWKPVLLGETWGRLVLDPPRCCVSYYRCDTCKAPLPQVPIGEWFDLHGRPQPGSMRWFVACPGCGAATDKDSAGMRTGFPDGVESWFRSVGDVPLWFPRRPEWHRGPG